jgi:putative thioredoxin
MPNETYILEGTGENFSNLVLDNSRKGPVLVDFWAAWAGPSLRQGELLRRLARAYGGRFLLVSLDTDREKEIAHRYGVKGLPSCKFFRHGKVAEEVHGMQTEADYRALIERHLMPLADRAQAAALAAWEAGDQDKAIQVLAEAAMTEPDNAAVPLRSGGEIRRLYTHLALIMAAAAAPPEAELTAALAQDPDDHAARFALAARRMVADDYAAALGHFAELERRAPGYHDGLAHEALLLVMDLLGPDHEQVRRYRRSLFEH